MKILIFGANGMLGSTLFRYLSSKKDLEVFGTIRKESYKVFFPKNIQQNLIHNIDVKSKDSLKIVIRKIKPKIIINCIGLIKQLDESNNPILVLPINAILPHKINRLCSIFDSRFIQISTDCVFSGKKGMYIENDSPDANDLYGKSKELGEVYNSQNTVTLRTSIIGHEINSNKGLIDWFLSQKEIVYGYKKVFFSGLPTIELAKIIEKYVLRNKNLSGLYHVSSERIDKFSLLKLVAKEYNKNINIIPDEKLSIDRSLNSSKFKKITGYISPKWPDLIKNMRKFK